VQHADAYSDLYPQAFRIGSAVGIQFHLEVDRPIIESWLHEYSVDLDAEKIKPESLLPSQGELEELSRRCRTVYHNFTRILK
jgi:GMP synthase (glutamine-hydrolysing)